MVKTVPAPPLCGPVTAPPADKKPDLSPDRVTPLHTDPPLTLTGPQLRQIWGHCPVPACVEMCIYVRLNGFKVSVALHDVIIMCTILGSMFWQCSHLFGVGVSRITLSCKVVLPSSCNDLKETCESAVTSACVLLKRRRSPPTRLSDCRMNNR